MQGIKPPNCQWQDQAGLTSSNEYILPFLEHTSTYREIYPVR